MKKREPIKHKLIWMSMIVSNISILLVSLIFVSYYIYTQRQNLANELILLNRVIADRTSAAINWQDKSLAWESLQQLKIKESIVNACLYDSEGNIFVEYRSKDNHLCPKDPIESSKSEKLWESVSTYTKITFKGSNNGAVFIKSDLRDLYPAIIKVFVMCIFAIIFSDIIAYIISSHFQRKIAKPIAHLAFAAKKIKNDVGFNTQVEVISNDEVGDLTILFNDMMQTIDQRDKKLAQINQHLKDKTTKLEKSLKIKSDFLSNMSHEIRTPIHGVINYIKIMQSCWDKDSDEDKLHYLNRLFKSAERLSSLINNLLDYSKLEKGKITLKKRSYDFIQLVEDVIDESLILFENKKDLKLLLDTDNNDNIIANIDESYITQVIRNLYGNAIKFTEKGEIKATLKKIMWKDQESLSFSLQDCGPGIPPSEFEKIFEPFVQSSATNNGSGGTGLGLAICKEIINEHGGSIWVQNNNNIPGAIFHFIIPLT